MLRSKGWLRIGLSVGSAIVVLVASFYLLDANQMSIVRQPNQLVGDSITITPALPVKQPTMLYGMVIDNMQVINDEIGKNQRFVDLLQKYRVNNNIIQQLALVPNDVFDFRKVAPKKRYTLLVGNDSLKSPKALIYEANAIDYFIFHLEDTLKVEARRREVTAVEKAISGVVQTTLSETIESMNISPDLTNKFVDIFAWQIDFQRLQKGDKFKLIYNESQVDGKTITINRIEAVYFEHNGQGLYAFPFDQGDGFDYFDEEGKSLKKALLKYPIEFTRISSRYSNRRFHPVAKVFRAHKGTDFAAPTGTPIRSVGDGVVLEAKFKSNNGNYVKIRHNETYATQYLHMSKIARGIRPGTRVKQGQTIGFVGSTGLATGPHLCYRFWKNGVQVDALRVQLPHAKPVLEHNMQAFELVKRELMIRLNNISFPVAGNEIAAVTR